MADNHGYSKKYRNWVPGVGLIHFYIFKQLGTWCGINELFQI